MVLEVLQVHRVGRLVAQNRPQQLRNLLVRLTCKLLDVQLQSRRRLLAGEMLARLGLESVGRLDRLRPQGLFRFSSAKGSTKALVSRLRIRGSSTAG